MNTEWQDFASQPTDPRADVAAAQAGTVVSPLTQFAVLEFAGEDAATFLQGQLSSDIRVVDAATSQYSSYSTPKGRMLASFLIWQRDGRYRLMLSADIAAAIEKRLRMYVLRSKVTVTALADLALIGVAGPAAAGLLDARFGSHPLKDHAVLPLEGAELVRLTGERYVLALPHATAADVWAALRAAAAPVGQAGWTALDIAAGTPWVSAATQEAFVPQMANMELIGAVSFQKGCYPGQEIVARSQYLGKVKRRMFRVSVAADAQAGQDLYAAETGEQAIGKIVLAVPAPQGGSEALAVVQTSAFDSGVHLGALDGPLLVPGKLPYPLAD